MKKELMIIGPPTLENKALLLAAKKRKFKARLCRVADFSFITAGDNLVLYYNQTKIKPPDICIVRGTAPYDTEARLIARFFQNRGTRIIDRVLVSKNYELHKLGSAVIFSQHRLPFVPTFYFSSWSGLSGQIKKLPAQVVVKDIKGRKSKNLFFLKRSELKKFFIERDPGDFIIQPKINGDYCYRVLVVGDRVLGSIRKVGYFHPRKRDIVPEEQFIPAEITVDMKRICLKAQKAFNYDIAGIDILLDGTKPMILEINRCPGFKGFMSALNLDVAAEIIKFIEKK